MADSTKSAIQLLEELRAERDELNTLIQALEKRVGITSSSLSSEVASSSSITKPSAAFSLESIPVGFFHNLSQAAATEKLLRLNPHNPLTTAQILDAFRRSGMTFKTENATTILYTALKRSPKFERVAGKAWGLAEWYPAERKRKKEDSESASASESESE